MSASIVRRIRWNFVSSLSLCTIAGCVCLMAMAGCEHKPAPTPTPPPSKTTPKQSTPPLPASPQALGPKTALVTGKGFSIRVEDAQRKLRHQTIYAPPKAFAQGTWMNNTRAQGSRMFRYKLIRELIADAVIEQESTRRGIAITPDEVEAHIKGSAAFNRFESQGVRMPNGALLPLPYTTLGFTPDDVREAAILELRRERLHARLLTEFTPEHFWEVWRHDKERVQAVMVRVPNRPQSYEIDSFVDNNAQKIKSYYDANPSKFKTHERTQVTLLKQLNTSKSGAIDAALARIKKGNKPDKVAQELGLELSQNVQVVRAQDRAIARAAIGDIGVSTWPDKRKRVWIVHARIAPKLLPLTKGIRREIGADLMRARGIIPSARAAWGKAMRALKALDASTSEAARIKAIASLGKQGLEVVAPKRPFIQSKSDFVPQIGIAPTLLSALFKAPVGSVLSEPMLEEQTIWAARVFSHTRPTREDYEPQKETFKAAYLAAQRDTLLDVFVARHAPTYIQKTHENILETLWGPSHK